MLQLHLPSHRSSANLFRPQGLCTCCFHSSALFIKLLPAGSVWFSSKIPSRERLSLTALLRQAPHSLSLTPCFSCNFFFSGVFPQAPLPTLALLSACLGLALSLFSSLDSLHVSLSLSQGPFYKAALLEFELVPHSNLGELIYLSSRKVKRPS